MGEGFCKKGTKDYCKGHPLSGEVPEGTKHQNYIDRQIEHTYEMEHASQHTHSIVHFHCHRHAHEWYLSI